MTVAPLYSTEILARSLEERIVKSLIKKHVSRLYARLPNTLLNVIVTLFNPATDKSALYRTLTK